MSSEPTSSSPTRRILIMIAKLAVSGALLWLLISRTNVRELWDDARQASLPWLAVGMLVYFANVVASVWRWQLLLRAQNVQVPSRLLLGSLLVALFFNNFLPSNIGGDFIRIKDTAKPSGSTTLATAVILGDRVIGVIALFLLAAVGSTVAANLAGRAQPVPAVWLWAGLVGGLAVSAPAVIAPAYVGRLLRPITALHPEWLGTRLDTLMAVLDRFSTRRGALVWCFAGAVFVQFSVVLFFAAVATALQIPIGVADLAVIVPLSFIVQMLPVSMNGFGVREAAFSFYFTRIGLQIHDALLVSLVPTGLVMLFSLSGAAVYVARRH